MSHSGHCTILILLIAIILNFNNVSARQIKNIELGESFFLFFKAQNNINITGDRRELDKQTLYECNFADHVNVFYCIYNDMYVCIYRVCEF